MRVQMAFCNTYRTSESREMSLRYQEKSHTSGKLKRKPRKFRKIERKLYSVQKMELVGLGTPSSSMSVAHKQLRNSGIRFNKFELCNFLRGIFLIGLNRPTLRRWKGSSGAALWKCKHKSRLLSFKWYSWLDRTGRHFECWWCSDKPCFVDVSSSIQCVT